MYSSNYREHKCSAPSDNEKDKEMTLDAAETVLGFFGFNRTAYSNLKNNNDGRRRKEMAAV
jgi:hypothetical protein